MRTYPFQVLEQVDVPPRVRERRRSRIRLLPLPLLRLRRLPHRDREVVLPALSAPLHPRALPKELYARLRVLYAHTTLLKPQ